MPKESSFVVVNTPGQCRWCKCTEDDACPTGCSWADRQRTLCSECVALDHAMKTTRGRTLLAQFLQVAVDGCTRDTFSTFVDERRGVPL